MGPVQLRFPLVSTGSTLFLRERSRREGGPRPYYRGSAWPLVPEAKGKEEAARGQKEEAVLPKKNGLKVIPGAWTQDSQFSGSTALRPPRTLLKRF